ncbi:unnamed protein product [Microthlaspi erraticum]|uniref:Uncharacterized protein n=1 Tax=Microthlaspi erraticum TaxID=1685480 RepID=A0A6D2KI20_9BRAS|nr:unnamed protein product [Microthlaspi erraticum]CAA7051581.1 unnamed protein product [Microthlaspi erraticum]
MAPKKKKGKGSKKGGKKPSGPGSSINKKASGSGSNKNLTENKLVEEVDVSDVEEDNGNNKAQGEDRVEEVQGPVALQRILEEAGLPASEVEKLVLESFPDASLVPESARDHGASSSHSCDNIKTCPRPSSPS